MRDTLVSTSTVFAIVAAMLATKTFVTPSDKGAAPVLAASSSLPDRGSSTRAATPN